MHRLTFAIVAAITTATLTQTAVAADMLRGTMTGAPPPPLISNWTGFYVGGNVGYSWGRTDIAYAQSAGNFDGFGIDGSPSGMALTSSLSPSGAIGGVQMGYDLQVGQGIFGVVADFDFRNAEDDIAVGPLNTFGDTLLFSAEQKWLGTVRGRVGMEFASSWLAYATGGFAYGKVSHSVTQTFNSFAGPVIRSFSKDDTKTGWIIGGGTEFRFSQNWSIGAEYLYVNLGTDSLEVGPDDGGGLLLPGDFPATTVSFKDYSHIVRATLNYKF